MFYYNELIKKINQTCGLIGFLQQTNLTEKKFLNIIFGKDYFTKDQMEMGCNAIGVNIKDITKYFFCTQS